VKLTDGPDSATRYADDAALCEVERRSRGGFRLMPAGAEAGLAMDGDGEEVGSVSSEW